MFDISGLQKALSAGELPDEVKGAFGQNKTRFPFLRLKDAKDGTYMCRFLPAHPQFNPDGQIMVLFHFLTPDHKEYQQILCPRAEDNSCAICDMYIQAARIKEALSQNLKEAFGSLAQQRFLYFAISIFADYDVTTVKSANTGKESNIVKWSPGTVERGGILQLSQIGFMKAILDLMTVNPSVTHHANGSYVKFAKNSHASPKDFYKILGAGEPKPIQNEDVMRSYPNLAGIVTKNLRNLKYDEMASLMRSCWWAQDPVIRPLFDKLPGDLSSSKRATEIPDFSAALGDLDLDSIPF